MNYTLSFTLLSSHRDNYISYLKHKENLNKIRQTSPINIKYKLNNTNKNKISDKKKDINHLKKEKRESVSKENKILHSRLGHIYLKDGFYTKQYYENENMIYLKNILDSKRKYSLNSRDKLNEENNNIKTRMKKINLSPSKYEKSYDNKYSPSKKNKSFVLPEIHKKMLNYNNKRKDFMNSLSNHNYLSQKFCSIKHY